MSNPLEEKSEHIISEGDLARIISESKKAEQAEIALMESEEKYRNLVKYAPAAIYEMDLAGTQFLSVNDVLCNILLYSREELMAIKPADLLDDTSRALFGLRIKCKMNGEKIDESTEYRIRRKDGEWIYAIVNVSAFTFQDDKPSRVVVIAYDITDRKKKEEELRKLNRTLEALSNSNQAMIRAKNETEFLNEICRIVKEDCGYHMVWIGYAENDQDKTITPVAAAGYNEGYTQIANITWADNERGRGPTGTAIRMGEPQSCRNMLTDPSFTPWRKEALRRGYASSLVIPIKNSQHTFGAITIYSTEPDPFSEDEIKLLSELADDLSYGIKAIRLRSERDRAITELRRTDEEKNNFITIMSHELRNPLTPILAGTQLIGAVLKKNQESSGQNADPIVLESIKIIEQQSNNMAHLLDDLLDISRINRGKIILKKQSIDLNESIKHAVKSVQPLIKMQKHNLSVTLPDTPLLLEADPVRLEQIIVNLLNNAIKYTYPGGKIILKASRINNKARISIVDNGVGVEPDKINSLFKLFSRHAQPYISTQGELGIGLKLTKDLVAMHEGAITVYSRGKNMGSEFVVELPSLPEINKLDLPVSKNYMTNNKLRILVVDDNESIAKLFARMLELIGHEVRFCYNGTAAIKLAAEYKPQIAMVDIGLPDMTGHDVARELRKMENGDSEKMKLIAITGYGSEEDFSRSTEAGFNLHLVKPVNMDTLEKVLVEIYA